MWCCSTVRGRRAGSVASVPAPSASRSRTPARCSHAADELAGHVLELQTRDRLADIARDVFAQRIEARGMGIDPDGVGGERRERLLLAGDVAMDRHEALDQFADRGIEQRVHLYEIAFDLLQVRTAARLRPRGVGGGAHGIRGS